MLKTAATHERADLAAVGVGLVCTGIVAVRTMLWSSRRCEEETNDDGKEACEAIVLAAALRWPPAGAAQTTVTSADIQRLQDEVYQASPTSRACGRSNSVDASPDCRTSSTTLRDEVIYLKVKLRKEGSVSGATTPTSAIGSRTSASRAAASSTANPAR